MSAPRYSFGLPPAPTGRITDQSPVLVFGGVSAPVSGPDVLLRAGNTYSFGDAVPQAKAPILSTIGSGLSNFLSTLSMGSAPLTNYNNTGLSGNRLPVNYNNTGLSGNVLSGMGNVQTAQIDGQTSWISGLRDTLGGVLGLIGSTGDAGATVTPVAVKSEGPNWGLIVFAIAGAGLAYYAATRK